LTVESEFASPAAVAFARAVAPRAPLYAILDAARESAGVYQARQAGLDCQSLYAGPLGDMLQEAAPYLIEFAPTSPFAAWWFAQWGNSIGILAEAPVRFQELRDHLRTLLTVRGEDRKRYYFRFYDPRVLSVFLPACTPAELDRFFGPITTIYCESAAGRELATFLHPPNGPMLHRSTSLQGTA